ncbi:MAG: hypothetical protein AAF799_35760 [Myxococcota bacterium]
MPAPERRWPRTRALWPALASFGARGLPVAALGLGLCWSSTAAAAPGQGLRLGGIEPQGPATRAVTGLYHNPAMLAAIPGTAVHASMGAGIQQQRIQRNTIDPLTGEPTANLGSTTWLRNGGLSYFAGASVYFDPIAVGIGIYDLGSRYQSNSDGPLRYHLAPDPDVRCLSLRLDRCPPNGGSVRSQQDLTMALAWNGGRVKLGAALHLPIVYERFAFDNDTELIGSDLITVATCTDKEDPTCTERVGFKGRTQWIPRNDVPSGFDFALTVGASVSLAKDTITLGFRYRSPALRRRGELVLGGVALVCLPEGEEDPEQSEQVPACDTAQPVGAIVRQPMPQQIALGSSFALGPARLWRLDLNAYWIDLCPGGLAPSQCPSAGSQNLRLIGLDRQSAALPEFSRYRGSMDLFGVDAYTRYRAKRNIYVLAAAHFATPSVRRGATSAAFDESWRLGTSGGVRVRLRRAGVVLVPGYGFDVMLPRRIGAEDVLFSPAAATAFNEGSGDLNAPGADSVLQGRGRPTNAGRYFGMLHTVSFALMWGERDVLD